jgi:hypothetical protein
MGIVRTTGIVAREELVRFGEDEDAKLVSAEWKVMTRKAWQESEWSTDPTWSVTPLSPRLIHALRLRSG